MNSCSFLQLGQNCYWNNLVPRVSPIPGDGKEERPWERGLCIGGGHNVFIVRLNSHSRLSLIESTCKEKLEKRRPSIMSSLLFLSMFMFFHRWRRISRMNWKQ